MLIPLPIAFFFFFNDTATTEIYTLSLHDALPICSMKRAQKSTVLDIRRANRSSVLRRIYLGQSMSRQELSQHSGLSSDRKSTRLNSSHSQISYAVFCLKKKKQNSKCKDFALLDQR